MWVHQEQQKFFVSLVQTWVNDHPGKYPGWFLNEFVSKFPEKGGYWNTVPDNKDKTMYFLLPKKDREKWSTGGRLNTQKGFKSKDPRWKEKAEYTPPKVAKREYIGPAPDYEAHKKRMASEQRPNEILSIGERMKRNWNK